MLDPATGKLAVKGDLVRLALGETLKSRLPREAQSLFEQLGLAAGELDINVSRFSYDLASTPQIGWKPQRGSRADCSIAQGAVLAERRFRGGFASRRQNHDLAPKGITARPPSAPGEAAGSLTPRPVRSRSTSRPPTSSSIAGSAFGRRRSSPNSGMTINPRAESTSPCTPPAPRTRSPSPEASGSIAATSGSTTTSSPRA